MRLRWQAGPSDFRARIDRAILARHTGSRKRIDECDVACTVAKSPATDGVWPPRANQTYRRWVGEFLRFHRNRAGRWSRRREIAVSSIPLGTSLKRGLRLRCPRCGGGRLFAGYFRMYESCPNCGLKYERAPGYFLGSTYINYGLTSAVLIVAYVGLHYFARYDNRTLAVPLTALCVAVPLLFFRYARAIWLAMDCYFDADDVNADDE